MVCYYSHKIYFAIYVDVQTIFHSKFQVQHHFKLILRFTKTGKRCFSTRLLKLHSPCKQKDCLLSIGKTADWKQKLFIYMFT